MSRFFKMGADGYVAIELSVSKKQLPYLWSFR